MSKTCSSDHPVKSGRKSCLIKADDDDDEIKGKKVYKIPHNKIRWAVISK
jgi:hypothetical protein